MDNGKLLIVNGEWGRVRGSKVQRFKGAKVQRFKGAKGQKVKGVEVQRGRGSKVQRFRGPAAVPHLRDYGAARPKGLRKTIDTVAD